jgi:hypothetical protein
LVGRISKNCDYVLSAGAHVKGIRKLNDKEWGKGLPGKNFSKRTILI